MIVSRVGGVCVGGGAMVGQEEQTTCHRGGGAV